MSMLRKAQQWALASALVGASVPFIPWYLLSPVPAPMDAPVRSGLQIIVVILSAFSATGGVWGLILARRIHIGRAAAKCNTLCPVCLHIRSESECPECGDRTALHIVSQNWSAWDELRRKPATRIWQAFVIIIAGFICAWGVVITSMLLRGFAIDAVAGLLPWICISLFMTAFLLFLGNQRTASRLLTILRARNRAV